MQSCAYQYLYGQVLLRHCKTPAQAVCYKLSEERDEIKLFSRCECQTNAQAYECSAEELLQKVRMFAFAGEE